MTLKGISRDLNLLVRHLAPYITESMRTLNLQPNYFCKHLFEILKIRIEKEGYVGNAYEGAQHQAGLYGYDATPRELHDGEEGGGLLKITPPIYLGIY